MEEKINGLNQSLKWQYENLLAFVKHAELTFRLSMDELSEEMLDIALKELREFESLHLA